MAVEQQELSAAFVAAAEVAQQSHEAQEEAQRIMASYAEMGLNVKIDPSNKWLAANYTRSEIYKRQQADVPVRVAVETDHDSYEITVQRSAVVGLDLVTYGIPPEMVQYPEGEDGNLIRVSTKQTPVEIPILPEKMRADQEPALSAP